MSIPLTICQDMYRNCARNRSPGYNIDSEKCKNNLFGMWLAVMNQLTSHSHGICNLKCKKEYKYDWEITENWVDEPGYLYNLCCKCIFSNAYFRYSYRISCSK